MIEPEPVSIAAVELRSVPAGLAVLDALVKEAVVRIRHAGDIDPGRWLILFDGPLADIEVALERAIAVGGDDLLESLLLPAAHASLRAALGGEIVATSGIAAQEGSLGALECHTVLATIAAADRALKAADVTLLRLRLATHIAGTGHAVVVGDHDAVDAALSAARSDAEVGVEVRTRLIARAAHETVAAAGQRTAASRGLMPFDP